MIKWKMVDPVPGDHLRVYINNIYHHGIYIGNNEVIQFGSAIDIFQRSKDIEVEIVTIDLFLNGGFLEVRQFTKKELKKKRNEPEIIKIALSRLGEKNYNILHNNCEHFVNECIFGIKISEQVDTITNHVKTMIGEKIKK